MSNRDLMEFFGRHLVGICVAYRHKNACDEELPPRFAACSGTLILIDHALFFLTAGHVLRELEQLRTSEHIEIETAILADTFGLNRVSNIPIPFDLVGARWFYVDDDKLGLDFGVVVLGPYYAHLLEKNGVVALSEQNWTHQEALKFDAHLVLGLPAELTSERVSDEGLAQVEPLILRVQRIDTSPDDRPPTQYTQFVGRLADDLPIKSVSGMSGGPIFGFQASPQPRYWIVAIQSSWNPNTRTVYGCSLPTLASLMTEWAREADQQA